MEKRKLKHCRLSMKRQFNKFDMEHRNGRFWKISISTPWKGVEGRGVGYQRLIFLKEGINPNWNLQKGCGYKSEKPSSRGVWVFFCNKAIYLVYGASPMKR